MKFADDDDDDDEEHSEIVDIRQGQSGPHLKSSSAVWIWIRIAD